MGREECVYMCTLLCVHCMYVHLENQFINYCIDAIWENIIKLPLTALILGIQAEVSDGFEDYVDWESCHLSC